MTHLVIKIQSVKDDALFPEFSDAEHAEIMGVSLLESGTVNGCTAAGIFFKTPDGKVWLAQTTAKLMRAMGIAANGAIKRFGDSDE
jgi:hypothetical protein